MQIMIDIDEEIFNKLPEAELGGNIIEDVLEAVENGTVLPKGHGDLIDRGKLKTHYVGTDIGTDLEVYLVPTIDEALIVIEADTESEVAV